ncbi:MAG: inositol monophosphatase family protein [Candidatus Micrarchaeia archaeon]
MQELPGIRRLLLRASRAAAIMLRKNFLHIKRVREKGPGNIVTNVDEEIEQKLCSMIAKAFPQHSIVGEEGTERAGESAWRWVVDPIDGTTNYARGVPFFNCSLAVARENEVVLGTVVNPITDELFFAERGRGAFLNGRKISVSGVRQISKAYIAYCDGHSKEEKAQMIGPANRFKLVAADSRKFGSAALELAYVACGRFDALVAFATKIWDSAAGSLLVREAGGRATGVGGENWNLASKGIIACNRWIYDDVRRILLEG